MKKFQNIILILIIILFLLVLGLGGYFVYDKILKDDEIVNNNQNNNNKQTIKTLTDNQSNSYTLKFVKGIEESTYEIVNSNNITVLSYKAIEYNNGREEKDEFLELDINAINFKIHNIESKTPGCEYLAFEFYSPLPGGDNQNYRIVAVNNGKATEIIDIGGHGTSYHKEKEFENGDIGISDEPLSNYIIEENTISFYYDPGCIDEWYSKFGSEIGFFKVTLLEDDYTIEKIETDYKVVVAGAKC